MQAARLLAARSLMNVVSVRRQPDERLGPSASDADALGRARVGEGYRVASDGKTLVSESCLRVYRPTESGSTTSYDLTYLGVTDALSSETLSGATTTTKKYAFDVFGRRATISEGASRFGYLYDPHGSVSLLLDQAGTVKSSYGYSAYGASNSALTKTAAGFSLAVNPYRYTGKRLDSGSNTLDMGARRYNRGTSRFLQVDRYDGALDNLGLSLSPLMSNRYALAGGNPVNYVEVDGHRIELGDADGRGRVIDPCTLFRTECYGTVASAPAGDPYLEAVATVGAGAVALGARAIGSAAFRAGSWWFADEAGDFWRLPIYFRGKAAKDLAEQRLRLGTNLNKKYGTDYFPGVDFKTELRGRTIWTQVTSAGQPTKALSRLKSKVDDLADWSVSRASGGVREQFADGDIRQFVVVAQRPQGSFTSWFSSPAAQANRELTRYGAQRGIDVRVIYR